MRGVPRFDIAERINDRRNFQFFQRRNRGIRYADITDREFRNIVDALLISIQDAIVEDSDGLYLEEMGYFGILKSVQDRSKIRDYKGDQHMLFREDESFYVPCFIPTKPYLKGWRMDRAMNVKIIRRMWKNIAIGKKYKFRWLLVKDMLKK